MSTPYEKILKSFHSQFKSKYAILPELEEQYFINALGDYELELASLTYDEIAKEIAEDLTKPQINILGALMYKYYKKQELDGVLKLNNIVGKDIALTSMGDSKSQMNKSYAVISLEIADALNKLKENSFN